MHEVPEDGAEPGAEPDAASDARADTEADTAVAHRKAASRRRLAEIFGDELPQTTSDERDSGGAAEADTDRESWYRQNRPPHYE